MRGDVVSLAFRSLDTLLLACLALAAFGGSVTGQIWSAPLAALAPHIGAALISVICLASLGAYGFRRRESLLRHLARVTAAVVIAGLSVFVCLRAAGAPASMIRTLQMESVLSLALLLISHGVWLGLVSRWRRLGYLTPNVVLVGANENARLLIQQAVKTGEIAVLGIFDDRHERAPGAIEGVPVLGDTRALLGHRIMPYVDRVVITVTASARTRVRSLVDRLGVLPNDITLLLDLGSPQATADTMSRLADMPLARLSGQRPGYRRVIAKRLQDLLFGALALILATPMMVLIALLVKLDSPGPVFFRQRRQGFNNEEIVVWKFRSMRHEQQDTRAIKQVRSDDPRITRIGRMIRRTSLDELPQLFNVLAGEMSLVGPRPHSPAMKTGDVQSALLVSHYAHRHRIKPGMTGWAAVNGSRGPVDTPELVRRRVELDVVYIERQSFLFDLYIMVMTLPCLLGDGQIAR
ncbi:MAG TPA: exopolysaccharide biosynthesis polyprenyl glycosylphosphotransferase [Caulobacteraceae bacterium]|jgi:Undecaprenyl-phosphate glucose phosphotransferase